MDVQVREVRQRFLEEYERNQDLYDYVDVERVTEDDDFIQRFILFLDQGPEKGFQQLKNCCNWRKSYGVNDYDCLSIPREIYQTGGLFSYLPDKQGVVPLYIRIKMYHKIDLFTERTRKYMCSAIERTDNEYFDKNGWSLILDCTDARLENVDIASKLYILNVTRNYYPLGCKYIILYNLPFLLRCVASQITAMLPKDLGRTLRCCGKNDLIELFDRKNLPDFLDGECDQPYRMVPRGAKSYREIGQSDFGLSTDKVEKLFKCYKKYADANHSVEVDAF